MILEDYVKSRDIYKCPSAKITNGAAFIVPMGRDGYWPNNYADYTWWQTDHDIGPCYVAWPVGWGGDVTDSFVQHALAGTGYGNNSVNGPGANVFIAGIGFNTSLVGLNLSVVQDAGKYFAIGDAGRQMEIWETQVCAYPDTCAFNGCGNSSSCPAPICTTFNEVDWANCSWSQACGVPYDVGVKMMNDASLRKKSTRHMGGSNVGFVDGHAKWYLADVLCTQAEPFKDPIFEGICSCWPGRPGY